MYEYRQVISHMRLGESDRAIARSGLVSRTKAKEIRAIAMSQQWLEPTIELPSDKDLSEYFESQMACKPNESLVLPYYEEVEQWVQQSIQATTIQQALMRKYGFSGSYSSVQRLVKKIKSKRINATTVLNFLPGESAQVDFGSGPKVKDTVNGELVKTWVFVMVLSWSRHQYAELVTNQRVETWLGCHQRAFEFFNGVPHRIIIDNAKCAITKACYYDPEVQRSYGECAQGYGFVISACPPREPKKKGRVESGIKYVKKNFFPLRDFRDLADANAQLKHWVISTAGNRMHGSTRQKPLKRFEETEKYLLHTLPDRPVEKATWKSAKVHGDCHIQFEKNRYSVPHTLVSKTLWLRANETTVCAYDEHELVAIHPRYYQVGQRHTIDEHLPPNAQAFKMRDPQWCLKEAQQIGEHCQQVVENLLSDTVLDKLRTAQGVVGLQASYGKQRLEAACHRALAFGTINYRSIKTILKSGVEYDPLPEEGAFDKLADAYTGSGKYCRNTKQLIQ